MPPKKNNLPEYLFFTRKERMGIVSVILLMILFSTLPFLYTVINNPQPANITAFQKEIAKLRVRETDNDAAYVDQNAGVVNLPYQPLEKKYQGRSIPATVFYFDPNTLPVEGWIKLGIPEKTANTIRNYISKGGRFYKTEDIGKIWGMRENDLIRLLPYVKIVAKPLVPYNKYPDEEKNKNYEKRGDKITSIDVNNADTAAFIALPGIGNKLAARIIAFREKLGGFHTTGQVAETYGLPDSTFQKIKNKLVLVNGNVKKLNINTATMDELKTHPYLRYNLANALVQYRDQHGGFSAVSDIKRIMLFTDEIYNKVVPYLTVK